MTLVGIAGLLFALSAAFFAELKGSRQRLVIFVLLFVMHSLASSAFYAYALASGSDSQFYYYDTARFYGVVTGLGTAFILNSVQIMKEQVGGTFFDYFMVFNGIGFWGFVFLTKTFNEIFEELDVPQGPLVYLPLFLPGLHFWTGFIGKDAPLFLAVCLAVWACMQFNKRMVAMGIAVTIMLAIRPHIAVIALVAIGLAAVVDSKTKLWIKGLLVAGVVIGTGFVVTSFETTYRINVSSAEGVSEFMAGRSSISEESGADASIVQANLPVKVISLWLRPFFIDAENSMGYIASIENAVLLLIFGYIIRHYRLMRRLFRRVLYIRFCVIFFVALTALLAAVNFNVGLGLRQKMMAMPCILAILATLLAMRATAQVPQPALPEAQFRAGRGKQQLAPTIE